MTDQPIKIVSFPVEGMTCASCVNRITRFLGKVLADLRARSGLSTEQLIYLGRAEGWLIVPGLESD